MTSSPILSPTAIPTGFQLKELLSYNEKNIILSLSIVSGLLSFTGSITIVIMIIRQKRLSSTYGRLIFGMNCMSIMQSFAYCLSTIPAPSSSRLSENTWPYLGTSTTCSIQGFFLYTGSTGTTIYYCTLCIYFVLVVLQHVTLNSIKHRFEPYLHAIPLIFSFTCGIFLAATESFNSVGYVCSIATFPYQCHRLDPDTCTRGKNTLLYRILFQLIPIVICFIIILVSMICLLSKVQRQRNLMQKYQYNVPDDALPDNNQRIKYPSRTSSRPPSSICTTSKNTTYRALQYIAVFFFTYIFAIINQTYVIITKKALIELLILQQITLPAQGFFNFIVFMLPIVRTVQKIDPEIQFFKALLKAIVSIKKLDESKRDYRSKLDKLRKPSLSRKGFTTRELHQQEKDRDAALFILEVDGEELKEEEI